MTDSQTDPQVEQRAEQQAESPMPLRVVVIFIAASAPLALGFETLIRRYLFMPLVGAELGELREFYWPALTPALREARCTTAAWVLVGVSVLAGLLGLALLRGAAQRGLAAAQSGSKAQAKVRDQMLLFSSVPQIPAVLATLCFSFGAELLPVLVSMVISTAFVLGQGFVGERLLGRLSA